MKDKLFIIGKIISFIVFIFALSSMGFASGKPVMMLAYAAFILVVMFIMFLIVKRNQRHFEIINQVNPVIMKILGSILMIIAIASPVLVISNMQIIDLGMTKVGFGAIASILLITLVFIAGGGLGVKLINKSASKVINKVLGYIIIVIISALPALMVMPHDKTTTGIGTIYYLAIFVAIVSWWGVSLFLNNE